MNAKIIPAALLLAALMLASGCSDPAGPGRIDTVTNAIGAAYRTGAGDEVILIDRTGTRFVKYFTRSRSFSAARNIEHLDVGGVFDAIAATGNQRDNRKTYVLSHGRLSLYDRATDTFTRPGELGQELPAAPFSDSAAATPAASSDRTFFFDETGTRYALWNYGTGKWTGVQDFATEFGGGGAPISTVGAAFIVPGGSYYLFDITGTKYTIYAGNGRFAPVKDVSELGDGTLRF